MLPRGSPDTPASTVLRKVSKRRGEDGERRMAGLGITRGWGKECVHIQSTYLQENPHLGLFLTSVTAKTTVFHILSSFYSDMRYKRDRLRAYGCLQITEAKLLKRYLEPDNLHFVVIFWEVWSKTDGWRHQGPVPHN
jgi:hypothetical protein